MASGQYIGQTVAEYKHKWYLKNRDKRLQQEEERRSSSEVLLKVMYNRAKRNAHKRGIEFSIQPSDLILPEYCPIFKHIKLTWIAGKGFIDSNISLDRINSQKGYVPGNVQVVSYKANRNKNNSTLEELMALGDWARAVSNS